MTHSPSPTITGMRTAGREADRTVITLSDEREFTVGTDVVLGLGLSRDTPIDAQTLARLEDEDLRFRAKSAALGLLAVRPRSRRELRDRLRRKEVPDRVIAEVLDRLEAIGLVDDRAFAESYVRDRVRVKPRGRRALRSELAQKGVRDEAEAAIEAVFENEEVDDRALARQVAGGWLRRQPPKLRNALDGDVRSDTYRKALRRYLGYMGRRGFHAGVARDVLAEARADS